MQNKIFVPEKIAVGFQERDDTYTGRLAYVIYYDEKGKLRKETSWNQWRSKGIEPVYFDNVPTAGFVLNKKVGGYKGDWFGFRNTYVRVYDPRGFEFEIQVPNLLWILENCSSIKGKGLEGEFVYGWEGTELLLVPVDSPDYQRILEYTQRKATKEHIKSKDLVSGLVYIDRNKIRLTYLGRFDYYDRRYSNKLAVWEYKNVGKRYFFMNDHGSLVALSGLSNILEKEGDLPNSAYPDMMEKMLASSHYSPPDDRYSFHQIESPEELLLMLGRSWAVTAYVFRGDAYQAVEVRKDNYLSPFRANDAINVSDPNGNRRWGYIFHGNAGEYMATEKLYRRVQYLKNGKEYTDV